MLSFSDRHWGIFRCLGGSKSGTSFPGQNAIFLCGWWSIVSSLHGIIYASVASRDHRCVFCAGIVKKMSLISFSNAPSLDIFGILGGMCGTNHVVMFPHWQSFLQARVRLMSRLLFFKFPGLLDPPLLFGIYGWRGIIVFFRMSFWRFLLMVENSPFFGETVSAKCDTTEAMEPGEAIFNNRLNIPPSHGKILRKKCRHPLRKINRVGKWSAPPQGALKINTNGSSKGNPGPTGIGGVARDSKGDVQFVFSIYKGHHTNNLIEAKAILYVVKHACVLGWRRLICESDSQVVICLLNQKHSEVVSWSLALIVDQIHKLCTSLESVTFTHISREWNSVTDCLEKWASDHMRYSNIVDKTQLPLGLAHQLDHLVDLDRVV